MKLTFYIIMLLLPVLVQGQEEASAGKPWRHEASLRLGFGQGPDFSYAVCGIVRCDTRTILGSDQIGTALAYHYLRAVGALWLGAGGSLATLSSGRGERYAGLTALAEYPLGSGRLRPVGRLETGIGLPIGSKRLPIDSRSIDPILHPSVGLALGTGKRQRHTMLLSIGYRFERARFSYTREVSGNQVDRAVTYRRLSLTLASRF